MPAFPDNLGALRHREFRRLMVGTLCSTGGQWVQSATLGWVVYDLTQSSALLGAVLAMRAIPMLLLAPVSGVIAERFDRRRALALSQVLVVGISFALAAGIASGRLQVWHLFAFTLLAGVAMVFDRTLRNTLVFGTVPRGDVANAVALNSIAFSVMRTLGPAAAGFLIAWVGAAWNFVLQALLYAGVAFIAIRLKVPYEEPRRAAPASARAAMLEGLRYAVTDPVARITLALGMVPAFLLIPSFSALMPVFAVDVFKTGPEGLGLLLSAVGVGGILGGIAAVYTARLERIGLTQVVAVCAFAAALVGFALSPNMALAMLFLVIAGVAEMVNMATNHTALQMSAPPEMRGRVASLLPMFPAMMALGGLSTGAMAEWVGASAAVIVLSMLGAAVAVGAWLRSSALRGLRLTKLVQLH
ncbi:MAG: MFS transporter [Betaproteobacteria bacterium]|nr:MFS transporter [Betaproteobacteria bacterium]